MQNGGTLVLGVTGSIAAYKAAELVRLFQKQDWDVRVVMTPAATRFVAPLTFQTLARHPVAADMFAEVEEWIPGHVSMADEADVMLVAPCTANVLAKLAHGLADDLLTCTALATRAPLVVAPAMNVNMWNHAATRANLAVLRRRGVRIVRPGTGDLACGYEGQGRLAALDEIVKATVAAAAAGGRGKRSGGKNRD
jgi:phosphopantothenoylcysteine decarboxylase/phosphopantothenate--cysteine ligase